MKDKKRFGVSIPLDIAIQLDRVASSTGRDRSSIVVGALREYLHEDLHSGELEHSCSGVIIYFGALSLSDIPGNELTPLVKSLCIVKLHGGYVTVLFVEGRYSAIMSLRKALSKAAKKAGLTRYVPLYCSYGR